MKSIISITSQGQVTIPVEIRRAFGIKGATKAKIEKRGNQIIIKPQKNFWTLKGFLASKIKLSDKKLKEAKDAFVREWPRRDERSR